MATVQTNGIEMYYERSGAGEKVLLVHGLFFGAEYWRPQRAALDADFDVTAPDLRGQHNSEAPDDQGSYDLWNQAEDVHGLITALDLAPVHYVGLSMGGMIGMRLYTKHPEVFKSLTLIDTTARPEDDFKIQQYGAFRHMARTGQFDALRPVAPVSFFNDAYIQSRPTDVEHWLDQVEAGVDGFMHAFEAVDSRDDIRDRIGVINVPTLVIHGTEDIAIEPEKGKELADLIPGAKLEMIEGAAHQSNVDSADEVSRLLKEWLPSVREGAGTTP